tara:strand:+ start:312 stop:791 length:480 start_codon:yes stop_codon:yes gene_type:complete
MKLTIKIATIFILLSSCSKSDNILNNRNFNKGNWLLVNVNYADKTLELIDDKSILEKNKNGIYVLPTGDCGGTTCDGFIKLYQDGKLVGQLEYLTRTLLYESKSIKESYKNGTESYIEPENSEDFKTKWDSLVKANNYPTIKHIQPDDKDIILNYKKSE